MKCGYRYIPIMLLSFAVIPYSIYAQSFTVKGTVTASGTPVRYASVTFIDSYDFSVQYFALTDSAGNYSLGSITAVKQKNHLPGTFQLHQNYPNPFSSSTAISYELNKQSDAKVTIYDVLGREVRTFNVGFQAAGSHGVVWNGRNNLGKVVAPGVYLYRLQANGEAQVRKMVFGTGENMNSVLLPGIVSSQTKMGADAIQGVPPGLPSGEETFAVVISNTDSTSPTIVPKQIGNIVIQSDTTLNFSVDLPQAIVYLDSTQQIIRGFGANNIVGWVPDMTPAEVVTAFGNGVGQLGLTIMRLRISPDSTQFSINVPSALAAQNLGVTIIASPWTPPAWMKTNDNIVEGYLNPSDYSAYAAHLKAFADTMSSHGVSIYAISVQNEPDANVTYESCYWNATQLLNFMKNNAPSVGVPVFMPESQNFVHHLSDSTLNDSGAASHVAFIGGHIYGVSPSTYPLALSKGKELWMTEHYTTSTDSGNNWPKALPVAKEINDCMNANMSAYVWWYIVRFYGPIDQNGNPTKRGYIMSQYSKFVRPGYYRVSATASPLSNVYVTAYKNGTKVVIVALNMGSNPATLPFTLQGGTASSFTPYITSSTKSCVQGNAIPMSDGSFTTTLDPSSVTTFVSN